MFLAQARVTAGIHILAVADLSPQRVRQAMLSTGWQEEQLTAGDYAQALSTGQTHITDDSAALIEADGLDVVIEATGDPGSGVQHARLCCQHGRHLVMVNVEADALAGPLLAQDAEAADLVDSLAYGAPWFVISTLRRR